MCVCRKCKALQPKHVNHFNQIWFVGVFFISQVFYSSIFFITKIFLVTIKQVNLICLILMSNFIICLFCNIDEHGTLVEKNSMCSLDICQIQSLVIFHLACNYWNSALVYFHPYRRSKSCCD